MGVTAFGCTRDRVDELPTPPASNDDKAARPVAPLFTHKPLLEGTERLKKKAGTPTEALELIIHRDHIVLQARDRERPDRVLQYVYRGKTVSEPEEVELRGSGKLDDNLFSLADVNIPRIPDLCAEAVERVDQKSGKVSHVLVRRNLPLSADVQMRVYVSSPVRDGHLDANAAGKPLTDDK